MAKPEPITSAANPLLKDVRRAVARGSLTSQGWCVAETFHLLEEVLRSDCQVKAVLAAESAQAPVETLVNRRAGLKLMVLPDRLLDSLSATETTQGVIALVEPPQWRWEHLFRGCPLLVILDGLQDPGNCGAIVRTAEAFGVSGVLFLKGTASPYNPKTLRASAGSLFRVPFLHSLETEEARAILQQNRVELYAAVPTPGVPSVADVDFTGRCGLIIGNEARGVGEGLRSAALAVAIPTVGVESLNAAVAAGILLYEARRQRARPSEPPALPL